MTPEQRRKRREAEALRLRILIAESEADRVDPPRSGNVGHAGSTHQEGTPQPAEAIQPAPEAAPREKVGPWTALGRAIRSGPTLGLDDKIGAIQQAHQQMGARMGEAIYPRPLVEWAQEKAPGLFPGSIKGADGAPMSLLDVYRAARDANVQQKDNARDDQPWVYYPAEIASGAFLPLGMARTFGQAARNGARVGAVAGVGASKSDLTRGEVAGNLGGGLLGGAFGALAGPAGLALGNAMSNAAAPAMRFVGRLFEGKGIDRARKVIQGGSDIRAAMHKPVSDAAARAALTEGGIIPLGTTEGAFRRLSDRADDIGNVYGSIVDDLESLGVTGPQPEALAAQLSKAADELAPNTLNDSAVNAYRTVAEALPTKTTGGPLRLSQAENLKRSAQEKARNAYTSIKDTELGDAQMAIASILRQSNEDAIERAAAGLPVGAPIREAADSFKPTKELLSRVIEAREAARKGASKAAQRSGRGLDDMLFENAERAAGNDWFTTQVLGGIHNAYRQRLPSTLASLYFHGGRGLRSLAPAARQALPATGAPTLTAAERATLAEWLARGSGE